MNYKLREQGSETRKCISVPFLGHNESFAHNVAQNLASVVKEVLYSVFPLLFYLMSRFWYHLPFRC